jgi:hypothetical protein
MRATWTLALLTIVGFSGFAHAEKWQARGELLADQSMNLCPANYGRELYPPPSFEFVDNTLSLSNKYGVMFTIAVPADGAIRHAYAWPNVGSFVISGNVKSREFQISTTSNQLVCRWKVIPQQSEA